MCWKNGRRYCPRCRNKKIYTLSDKRFRCPNCGYTFHDFSRRFINNGKLSSLQWLELIKLFVEESPPGRIRKSLGLSHNTAQKGVKTIRAAVMAHSLDIEAIFSLGLGSLLGTARAKRIKIHKTGPPPGVVFGLIEHSGMVFADVLPEIDPDSVLHFKYNFRLQTNTVGNVVYTGKYRHYSALLLCDPELKDAPQLRHNDKDLFIDSTGGFWPYAKERLRRSRGISPRNFPLLVKELEFRYNQRGKDLFPLICLYLCDFVPKLK